MKIVIPGGSGQVGTVLARHFHRDHEVVVLSRTPEPAPWRVVPWNARTLGPWAAELDGADVVINLAGRSVHCRYGTANRREIIESRVASTQVVGEAIARCRRPPAVWLQAATATMYSHRFDAANDDYSGILGGNEPGAPRAWQFSLEVAREWERALEDAVVPRTRRVAMRSAVMMAASDGGAFDELLALVRHGLGGRAGDGRQWVSWIHERDLVRAVEWLIARDDLVGPIIIGSPHPLPHAEFMRVLREAWGTRVGLPLPVWLLEIGAFVRRIETELLLKSRRVVPSRLVESGFTFEFPEWPAAARDLVSEWRRSHARHHLSDLSRRQHRRDGLGRANAAQ